MSQAIDELARAIAEHPDTVFLGAVSTAFVCPFEGTIAAEKVVDIVDRFAAMGVERVGLADTLGIASSEHVAETVSAVQEALPRVTLGLHLHDGEGQALTTVDSALELGTRHFDSAVGGYGGCPFAPGAHGNLATEALVAHLHARGVDTGIDLPDLLKTAGLVRESLRRGGPLPVAT